MSRDDGFLTVSEDFYSIQGEGPTMGQPSVFLRLTGCNLTCSGWSYISSSGKKIGCDSADVWTVGTKQSYKEIIDKWEQNGLIQQLKNGAHLICTGGEPTLQQQRLVGFLEQLEQHCGCEIHSEVETNSTIAPTEPLIKKIDQWNVSAKLSNNGDPKEKRYIPTTLAWHAQNDNSFWKFVICNEKDVDELFSDFIKKFNISHRKVWLMPEGTKDEILKERSVWIADLCKQHTFNFSHRLQVYIWGEVTGV